MRADDTAKQPLKVLHLSFHRGCIKDFEVVSKELGLELTSWFIADLGSKFDGNPYTNTTYTLNHARAERVWNLHKAYFESFDAIVTSDTAPLCRIFLQNNWRKPLIIWICNRFDYYDQAGTDGGFPDAEYFELFRKAATQENVTVINYTQYEHLYALHRDVNTGSLVIKPCGSLPQELNKDTSQIPREVNKQETFFIPSRFDSQEQINHLITKCREAGIATYCGTYNGPDDLTDFKGVIHFPYNFSNLALFENMQRGLVHFVPSLNFARQLYYSRERHKYRFFENGVADVIQFSEWYNGDNKDVIIYFDSWHDLRRKIHQTDFSLLREKVRECGVKHRATMLNRWCDVFNKAQEFLSHKN
jgi:hypothetical protein